MSYPLPEVPYEAKEIEHQDYHIAEHIFDDKCEWCNAEKCSQCKGAGMDRRCNMICGKCDGRGRII